MLVGLHLTVNGSTAMNGHNHLTAGVAAAPSPDFSDGERQGVYRAIQQRRDIRHFRPDPIPDATLTRLIRAAHQGPSVGFMQPWDFILVRDIERREQVKELFHRERQAAACFFDEPRRSHYLSLKLEGLLDAPVNLCVTCDPTRAEVVLGRNSMPETDVYSTCCAVQNLWLAARSEGIGVGWVSILKLPPTAANPGHTPPRNTGSLPVPGLPGGISATTPAGNGGLASTPAPGRTGPLRNLGGHPGQRRMARLPARAGDG